MDWFLYDNGLRHERVKNLTRSSYYPDIWKRSNITPVHKKNDKQLINTTG